MLLNNVNVRRNESSARVVPPRPLMQVPSEGGPVAKGDHLQGDESYLLVTFGHLLVLALGC